MTTCASSPPEVVPAPIVPGYDQLEQIGRGGLGDVYRARCEPTGATVAIKVLRDGSDPSAASRIRREWAALDALRGHPHVIEPVELLATPAGSALVMEFAPGGSLAGLVERVGPLGVGQVALVGAHAAAALARAHELGIVHRDVKPHNLLIDAQGRVKLCDFGVAALTHSAEFAGRTSAVSVRFASPEDLDADATGANPVGPPSDIYSLGATLLFLARGVHLELRDRMVPWSPPPDAPPTFVELDRLIAACLRPSPHERPTAHEAQAEFERIGWLAPVRCRALPVGSQPVPAVPSDLVWRPSPLSPSGPVAEHTVVVPGGSRRLERDEFPVPRPVAAPRRVARARSVRSALVVFAAAAVLGLALVAITGWPGGETRRLVEAAQPALTVVGRPVGLADLTAARWPAGQVGGCLVQESGEALLPIECDQPHDLERVAVGELPDLPGTRFDSVAVARAVDERCLDGAAVFVGGSTRGVVASLGLSVAGAQPSADAWMLGERTYECFVGVPAARVVGSAAQVSS